MRLHRLLLGLALLLGSLPARADFVPGEVVLDGRPTKVSWNDGDSFSFKEGRSRRKRARLLDVNTLENFGPVHRWGDWTTWELYGIADEPLEVVKSGVWKCTSAASPDGYGRLLVRCPDLARALVQRGLAMVFAVDSPPDKDLLALQAGAQKRKVGMWLKGVPPQLITSAHSVLEGKGYNRVVDTRTGNAAVVEHEVAYDTCDQVCTSGGKDASCLVFVPFKRRYDYRPPCVTDRNLPLRPPRVVEPPRLKQEPAAAK